MRPQNYTHFAPLRTQDRRKIHTFLVKDRRSGVGCRRRVQAIEEDIRCASRVVKWLPRSYVI